MITLVVDALSVYAIFVLVHFLPDNIGGVSVGRAIKTECTSCHENFYIQSDWANPPTICGKCRARAVPHLVARLGNYVRAREAIDAKPCDPADRKALTQDREVRLRIQSIINRHAKNEEQTINALVSDKDIRKLIFRLVKEKKINEHAAKRYRQKTGKRATPKKTSLVQGGSPGLGKRS